MGGQHMADMQVAGGGNGTALRRRRRRVVPALAGGALLLAGLLGVNFLGTGSAGAASVSCTHTAGDTIKDYVGAAGGSFETSGNWSPSGVPGSTTIVCIASGKSVVMGASHTVGGVNSQGSLTINSGFTLTINTNASSVPSTTGLNSSINNLTLTGALAGNMNTDLTGANDLSQGTIQGTGVKTVLAGATAAMTGGSNVGTGTAAGTLKIAGTATWTGSGYVSLGASSLLEIQSGGVFNASADDGYYISDVHSSGTVPRVLVDASGLLERKTSPGTNYINTTLDNNGTIRSSSGDLYITGGNTASQTDSGTWDGTTGTISLVGGTRTFVGGSVTGANGLHLSGATLTTPTGTPTAMSNLLMDSGTLNGSQTISGSFTWNGGAVGGSGGTTLLDTGSTSAWPNTVQVNDNHILKNKGTLTLTAAAGTTYLCDSSVLDNASPGVINILATSGYSMSSCGTGNGSMVNESGATVNKNTDPGDYYITIPFDNAGAVHVNAGILHLYANSASGSDTGSWSAASGTSLSFDTTHKENGSTFTGAGMFVVNGTVDFGSSNISVPNLTLAAGLMQGTETITGTFTWNGGQPDGAGTTTLQSGIVATAPSGGEISNGHTLLNKGTLTWGTTAGYLQICDSSILENASGAVFNIVSTGGYSITSCGATDGLLKNDSGAVINKNTGTDATYITVPFDKVGTVNVNAGELVVYANGPLGSDTGNWNVATGTLLTFGTTRTENASTFTGAGTVQVSGTVDFGSSNISVPKLTLLSGYLRGTETITTTFTWTGGQPDGAGTTTLQSGIVSTAPSGGEISNGHTLVNKGTMSWGGTSGYLYVCDGSTLENASGGVFNIISTGGYSLAACGSPSGQVKNDAGGTINKNTAVDTTYITAPFDNAGTVNVNAGTLQVAGNTTGGTDTGTWNVAAAKTLEYNGTRTENAATFTGAGTHSIVGGAFDFGTSVTTTVPKLALSAGTMSGNVTIGTSFTWSGGAQVGAGTTTIQAGQTLTIPSGATLDTGHVLLNLGTATWGPSGYFYVQNGAKVENGSGGQFNLTDTGGYSIATAGSPDGAFVNDLGGTVTKTTANASYIAVPFDNFGTVNVTNGTLSVNAGSTAGSTGDSGSYTSTTGKTLTFDAGTRKFNGGSVGGTGNTNFTGGTFTGTPTLTKLTWTGGSIGASAVATVPVGGSLSIPNGADLTGKILNQGTTTWGPSGGYLYLDDGAVFENASGGLFSMTNTGGYSLSPNGSTGRFVNDAGGTVARNTATDLITIGTIFDNQGTVQVNAGTLAVTGSNSVSTSDAGSYTVASGKTLAFNAGTRSFTAAATVTGPGAVTWGGAILSGSPTYSNTTIAWNAGNIAAPGTTTIGASATLNMNSGVTLDGGTILNQGTTNWNPGYIQMANNAQFLNAGLFDVKTSSGYQFSDTTSAGPLSKFTNQASGTFRMNLASTTAYVSVPFHNDGNIAAQNGVLQFNGPVGTFDNFAGTTLTGGTYTITKTLQFTGANIVTNAATIVLNSGGAIQNESSVNALTGFLNNAAAGTFTTNASFTVAGAFANAGNINVNAGTFQTTSFTQSAGATVIASGATLKPTGGTLAVNGGVLRGAGTAQGDISGAGTVSPGLTAGTIAKLTETGAYGPAAGGTLAIDLNGATTAGTDYDQLAVSGAATLNGTLALNTTYSPVRGQTLTIATFASRTGTFSSITGQSIPGGLFYDITYNPTSVVLTVVSVPGAPTIGTGTRGNAQVTLNWTAPADNGGAPITGYVVTPYIGAVAQTPQTFNSTATSQIVTGLTNGTAYTFKVAAINEAGTGAQSAASNVVTPATIPGAPTIGTATPGNTQATVTWTAPADNGGDAITGYVVTPYISAAAQTPQTFNSTATTQNVTGLANGTTYTFKVAAINTVGTGPQSSASNAVTPATAPDAPTIGTATPGNTQVSLTWTAPANNGGSAITGYVVTPYIGASAQTPQTFNSTATTQNVTGLTNGTAYTFTVAAINGIGTGAQSAASNAATPLTVPDAPTIGTATAGNAQATVTWTAPANNGGSAITGYVVTPYIGASAQTPQTFNSTATTQNAVGLTNGSTYTFKVAAINGAGTGAQSAASNAVTLATVAGAPTIGTATAGNTQATVTWTAPASNGGSAITGYVVTPFIGAAAQTPQTFNSTATTQNAVGLTNGTTYTFTVAAINAVGTGPASAASNAVTPATVPGAPTIGTATAGSSSATVTWTAPASNGGSAITGYVVTPFIGASAQTPQTFNSTATTQNVTGLTNGTTYTFTVAAINGVGTGAASAASNPVTPVSVTVPGAPTIGTATAGNTQATVTWTAPASNGGSAITGYVVTPYIGASAQTPQTFNSTATTQNATGLTNGTTYTFTVAAINGIGTGPQSGASNAVTPATLPGAPTIGTATAGSSSASLTWTAPASNGGSAITGYVVTPFIGASAQTAQTFNSTATTQNVVSLTPGTAYTFTVAAINGIGTGPQSVASNSATPYTVPGAPTIGTATAGNTQATVTWTAPASNGGSAISGYVVTPFIGASAQTPQTFNSTATTQNAVGLTNGTTYTFTVAAINAAGTGNASAASNAVTPATVPGAPTIGTATPGNTQVTLTWSAPASNGGSAITGYVVTPFIGASAQTPQTFNSTATTQNVTGLTNGTAYTFTVAAINSVGTGAASAASNTATPRTVPGAPTIGTATAGNTQATVTWTAPASNGGSAITGYVVTPFIGASAQTPQTFNSTATSQNVTGLTNGTTYTFTVAAINAAGTGAASGASNPVTPFVASVPGAPTIGTATPGNAKATLTWTAPASDGGSPITGYVVTPYIGATAQTAQTFNSTATTQNVTGLTNGTTYTFTVAAKNAVGTGSPSGQSNAVTPASATVPGAPTVANALPGNTTVALSWTAPASNGGSSITGYVVTPFISGVAQTAIVFNSTGTSQTITGLTNGTTYTFQVAAKNAIGTGPNSADSIAVTPGTPSAPGFPGAAPGNNSAKVAWTTPSSNNGSAITGYQVTPYIGATAGTPRTFNTTAVSDIVTGLVNGTTYTFSIRAINANGVGAPAVASAIVVGAPTAPVFPNATPGNAAARVGWVASTANGAPVTSYTITAVKAGVAQTPVTFGSATFETMTGLTNGVSYTFRVTATNSLGTSPVGTTSAIIVGTPAQPGFISATPGNGTALVLFTTPAANASPLISFTVTPYIGSTAQTPQVFNTPAATQLTLTGLTNGTSYTFRAYATNALGSGPLATTSAIIVGTPTGPGFPGAAPGNGTAKVAWLASNPNGSAVTGYVVTPLINGAAQTPQTFNSAALTETVTGLANGTSYTFRVAGINALGTGPFATSTTAIKVGTPTAPGFPSTAPGNASAQVSWQASTANASPITGYVVTPYIGTVAQTPHTFNTNGTSQAITGLTNGTTYTFRVAAINSIGTGPYSTTGSVKVGLPLAPTGVGATAQSQSALVHWNAATDNGSPITGYIVTPYIGTTAQAPQTFNSNATSETVTGLTAGTTYTFKVQAINAIGTGAASSASSGVVILA